MADSDFFAETSKQSLVKMSIVLKYFDAWAKVMISRVKPTGERIAYLDLFAGPGRYLDGTQSTPLLVLEKAIADGELCKRLVTVFNDKDEANVRSLERAIRDLPGIERLAHPPQVLHHEVGAEMVRLFEGMQLVPTLFFVDPWGYKGLSLQLVNSVLKDFGCDCIFFFNYNRINMGLGNPAVEEHMNALFGSDRTQVLRPKLEGLATEERELAIVESLCEALGANKGGKAVRDEKSRFVLPFRFRDAQGARTSHHLIFVSKHFRGYEIMKDIMARESSTQEQGVPRLEFNPATDHHPLLFELFRPLDDLKDLLLEEFAGRTMTMREIYEAHSVGRRFVKKNYKDVLVNLEAEGRIVADPPPTRRRCRNGVVTFADGVRTSFPPRKE